ncbi:MAG: signal recognition particle protein, partial [Dolichospermum sp.]
AERTNPELINPSRKNRIARGSGKSLQEINAFLKQFEQMKQTMKMMNNMPSGGFPGMRGMR